MKYLICDGWVNVTSCKLSNLFDGRDWLPRYLLPVCSAVLPFGHPIPAAKGGLGSTQYGASLVTKYCVIPVWPSANAGEVKRRWAPLCIRYILSELCLWRRIAYDQHREENANRILHNWLDSNGFVS